MMRQKAKKQHLLCTLLLILLLCGCTRETSTRSAETLQTIPASLGDIEETMTFIGNVGFIQTVSSGFETSGVVEEVYAALGDKVHKGDVLASLERDYLDSSILKSEVGLLSAEDELEELLLSDTARASAYKELKDAEVKLDKAERYQISLDYPRAGKDDIAYYSEQEEIQRKNFEEAKEKFDAVHSYENSAEEGEYDIYEALRKAYLTARDNYGKALNDYNYYSGKATQNERDQAAADIGTAENAYEKAKKNFATYGEYPRPKDVAAAEQKVSSNQKSYNKRLLVADIDGTIAELNIHPGDYVTGKTNLVSIHNRERYLILFDPSELDANTVSEGQAAHIRLDADPDRVYQGVVTYISENGSDDQNRAAYHAVVEILDPDEKVLYNMTAEVDIVLNKHSNVLLIPTGAVTTEGNQAYASVADGENGTRKVKIIPGLMNEYVTEIIGGSINAGDPIAVESVSDKILTAMGIDPAVYYRQDEMPAAEADSERPILLFGTADGSEAAVQPPETGPQPEREVPTQLF